ncbi:unnamed protein product [Durusdinium trenchii]|uniref:Uncharacterized protein n=1 Tax=Durusdinium trenchii TaxID=1381693 RepID=A0ABP0K664_9DINO
MEPGFAFTESFTSMGHQWWSSPAAPSAIEVNRLELVLRDMLRRNEITKEERKVIQLCIQKLKELVRQLGEFWELHAIGSAATGFSATSGDLDVTCFHSSVGMQDSVLATRELKMKLMPLVRMEPSVELIEESWNQQIPSLKLRFAGCLNVDLSCHNVDGLQNTLFLKAYSNMSPLVKQLVVCIKLWAKGSQLCGALSHHLSSYAFSLMVIFFLQVHPNWRLPVLPTMGFGPDWVLDDVKTTKWTPPVNFVNCLSQMICDFFSFYAVDYAWAEEVMSVRLGRRAFAREPSFRALAGVTARRLHIEDPFLIDRNLNCTLGYEQEALLKVQFFSTYTALQNGQIPSVFLSAQTKGPGKSAPRPPPPPLHEPGALRNEPGAQNMIFLTPEGPQATEVPKPSFLKS